MSSITGLQFVKKYSRSSALRFLASLSFLSFFLKNMVTKKEMRIGSIILINVAELSVKYFKIASKISILSPYITMLII